MTLYNVQGKREGSPSSFTQIKADTPDEAAAEAARRGWTVEFVERADRGRSTEPDVAIPEYGVLQAYSVILRVIGGLFAALAVYCFGRGASSTSGIQFLDDAFLIEGISPNALAVVYLLIGFEAFVFGEAVAAFRHLVRNSWEWRHVRKGQ